MTLARTKPICPLTDQYTNRGKLLMKTRLSHRAFFEFPVACKESGTILTNLILTEVLPHKASSLLVSFDCKLFAKQTTLDLLQQADIT